VVSPLIEFYRGLQGHPRRLAVTRMPTERPSCGLDAAFHRFQTGERAVDQVARAFALIVTARKVPEGCFKRCVPEPPLNGPGAHPRLMVHGRKSFPEPMENESVTGG